jgi:hypothetical protein
MLQLSVGCNSGEGPRGDGGPGGGLGDDMRLLEMAIIGLVLVTAGSATVSRGQIQQTIPGMGQSHTIPGAPIKPGMGDNPGDPPDPLESHRAEMQEKMRNNDRQKKLVADTDKLLSLATDLKQQVDKSTKDTLSVDVIKKADEIEKLAHSVKERMKG